MVKGNSAPQGATTTTTATSTTTTKKPKAGEKRKNTATAEKAPKKAAKVMGPYAQFVGKSIPMPALKRCGSLPAGAMTVLCWNVAGLRALLDKRADRLEKLIKTEKPMVLGMLEHKLQEEHVNAVKEKLQKCAPGYTAHFTCSTAKKGYSGVCVLCREDAPPEEVAFGLPKGPASAVAVTEGRVATVEYKHAFVVFVYVPNSGNELERLKFRTDIWDVALKDHVEALKKRKPVILAGDMNAAHLDLDIWNVEANHVPKSAGTTKEERESFAKYLAPAGPLTDTLRHKHGEAAGVFSYWSVRAKGRAPNRGLRLDYVLCTDAAKEKLADAFVLPNFVPDGDHAPVGATFLMKF
jgi:exodeoxyribonuclease III